MVHRPTRGLGRGRGVWKWEPSASAIGHVTGTGTGTGTVCRTERQGRGFFMAVRRWEVEGACMGRGVFWLLCAVRGFITDRTGLESISDKWLSAPGSDSVVKPLQSSTAVPGRAKRRRRRRTLAVVIRHGHHGHGSQRAASASASGSTSSSVSLSSLTTTAYLRAQPRRLSSRQPRVSRRSSPVQSRLAWPC